MGYDLKMRIWRGDVEGGELGDYTVEVSEGEVVLDALHRVQVNREPLPEMPAELKALFQERK